MCFFLNLSYNPEYLSDAGRHADQNRPIASLVEMFDDRLSAVLAFPEDELK
jgi:hypothetical protein